MNENTIDAGRDGATRPSSLWEVPDDIASEIRHRKSDEPRESDSIVIRRLRQSFGLAKATCRLMISSYDLQKMRRALDHVTDIKRALTAALKERRLTSWIERAKANTDKEEALSAAALKAGADKEEALSAAEKVAAETRRLEFERGKREGAREQRNKAEAAELKKSDQTKRDKRVIDGALASVQQGKQPNVKGACNLAVVEIIDPEDAASNKGKVRPTKKVATGRDDPFLMAIQNGNMKGKFGSEVLRQVGLKLRGLYEAEEIGAVRGLDLISDRVDCRYSDTEGRRLDAINKLKEVEALVGVEAARFLRLYIGEYRTKEQIVRQELQPSSAKGQEKDEIYLGKLIQRNLDQLAEKWDFVSKSRKSRNAPACGLDLGRAPRA